MKQFDYKKYEELKKQLQNKNLTPTQYETEIKQIARKCIIERK